MRKIKKIIINTRRKLTPLEVDVWKFIKIRSVIDTFDFNLYGGWTIPDNTNQTVNIPQQQKDKTLPLVSLIFIIQKFQF